MKRDSHRTPTHPATARTLLWNTHHDQPETVRRASIALLNQQLVDAIDLGLQAKQAHWNVKGPQFAALHALFDEVAKAFGETSDELAERAVELGGVAQGTLQAVAAGTRHAVYPAEALEGEEHLWALSEALARFGGAARAAIASAEEIGDAGTVDLFTQISRGADKLLWQVEAHVALEPR